MNSSKKRILTGLFLLAMTTLASCSHRDNNSSSPVTLKDFPSVQQTTDYTCGCASALAVMHYYSTDDESEQDLAVKMHTHVDSRTSGALPGSAIRLTDFGTSVEELWNYFNCREDFDIVASSYHPESIITTLTDTDRVGIQAVGNVDRQFADYGEAATFFLQQLQKGHPIMVCWNLWGGHWTVCIGYDNNGTPNFFDDDLLTMADPYDSTDGVTDGYTRVGLVHFFYDWFCTMTPKPWQLQPYLIVAPKKDAR